MNTFSETALWLRAIGIFAAEVSALVLLALLVQKLMRSAFWRRAGWQICIATILFCAVSELTGLGFGAATWLTGEAPPEKKISARVVPLNEQIVFSEIPNASMVSVPSENLETRETTIVRWTGILWSVGFVIILARILFSRALLFLHQRRKIEENGLAQRVLQIAEKLGVKWKIRLFQSQQLSTPIAFGIFRPAIALPPDFRNFNSAEQDAMLAHEIAHLAARDPFWFLLADFVSAFLWWHPLVWFARRQLQAASEFAADEASAILENGPGTLAECLVHFGKQMAKNPAFGPLGVTGFRSQLGKRVEHLLNLRAQKMLPRRRALFLKTAVPIFLAAILVTSSGWMQNRNATRPKTFAAAVQNGWESSLGSTLLLAAATPLGAQPAGRIEVKQSADSATPPNESKSKLVLVEATFLQIPPGTQIEKPPLVLDAKAREKFASTFKKIKGVTVIGRPRMSSLQGREGELSVIAPSAENGITNYFGSVLKTLALEKDNAAQMQIEIRAGNSSDDKLTDAPFQLRTNLLVPWNGSAAFLSDIPGGTNYLVLVRPTALNSDTIPEEEPKRALQQSENEKRKVEASPLIRPVATNALRHKNEAAIQKSNSFQTTNLESVPAEVPPQLFTRTFKLDTNTVIQALENFEPAIREEKDDRKWRKLLNDALRAYFNEAGAELNPPKAVFFNDRNGMVLVRATARDLDSIEAAIQVLNTAPAQVMIEARFIEIPAEKSSALRVWENTLPKGVKLAEPAKWKNAAPFVSVGSTNVSNDIAAEVTGILTEEQFGKFLNALEKRNDVKILAAPKVTTFSGTQAQISIMDIRTVVTGLETIKNADGTSTSAFLTAAIPFGPMLDVRPHVSADNQTVQLSFVATVTEFVGYEKADPELEKLSPKAKLPLPQTRTRRASTAVNIRDGQTVVLGGLINGEISGDKKIKRERKNLLVFVTPRVVSATGGPVNAAVGK